MRTITLTIEKRQFWLIKGIYRITIGGMFYIGRAGNLYSRTISHEYQLNKALWDYPTVDFANHHSPWVGYINENQGINSGLVQVLQRCISDSDLYFAEQFYLNEYAWRSDYFNIQAQAGKPRCFAGELDKRWDVVVENRMPYFFDPSEPDKKVGCFEPLRSDGKPSVKKKAALVKETYDIINKIKTDAQDKTTNQE